MNVCIIPARGGSKRIPKKNIKYFSGKPIISYSIEAAIKSNCFDHVIVSTDCPEIAEVSEKCGAEVPFLRPEKFSCDHAGTVVVMQHATEWVSQNIGIPDYVCCLHATAPFVESEILRQGYEKICLSGVDYVFSATALESPFQRSFRIKEDGKVEMFFPEFLDARSQDIEPAFYNSGQFYWGRAQAWLDGRRVISGDSIPLVISRERSHDIDVKEDWDYAELLFKCINSELS